MILAAMYYARRRRWLVAGLLGGAAAICRAPGFLIALPLTYEYLVQRRFRWREIRADAAALLAVPLALFGLASCLRVRCRSAAHAGLLWHLCHRITVLCDSVGIAAFDWPARPGDFPLVMALALLGRNEHFHRSYLIVSTGLAAFFMLVFSQWGWVA